MKSVLATISASLWVLAAQPLQPPLVVKGVPYSADQVQQGPASPEAHIIGHFFRDLEGRTRTEDALKTGGWRIEIVDPTAGVAYRLDDNRKIAYRYRIQTTTTAGTTPSPEAAIEDLGTQIMEGLLVKGKRTSRALVIETWDSVELNVNILTKSSNGYSSRLINIRRTDPDPALFRPPADYSVVDQ